MLALGLAILVAFIFSKMFAFAFAKIKIVTFGSVPEKCEKGIAPRTYRAVDACLGSAPTGGWSEKTVSGGPEEKEGCWERGVGALGAESSGDWSPYRV